MIYGAANGGKIEQNIANERVKSAIQANARVCIAHSVRKQNDNIQIEMDRIGSTLLILHSALFFN